MIEFISLEIACDNVKPPIIIFKVDFANKIMDISKGTRHPVQLYYSEENKIIKRQKDNYRGDNIIFLKI